MDYGAGVDDARGRGMCAARARAKARVRGLGRTLERARRGEARGVNAQFNATRLTMCCA